MSASLPDGYVEIGRWEVGRAPRRLVALSLALSVVAFAVTVNGALLVMWLAQGEAVLTIDIASVLAGTVAGLALHELSHAAAFLALGGRPRFGARARTRLGPVLYVSAPGYFYRRGGYLFAGVGAVLVLTALLLGVVAVAPTGGFVSAAATIAASLSTAGAAGDALIARAVMAFPAHARFEDTGEGFIAYGPAPAAGAARR